MLDVDKSSSPDWEEDDSLPVSVVVCTYERAESLKRFLKSLQAQTSLPREIIIVDASRTDHAEQVLAEFEDLLLSGRLRYFRVDNHYRGLTKQRNFALRHVTSPLVAFFDDDVVLEPYTLRELVQVFERDKNRNVVGVGAYLGPHQIDRIWRLRKILGIVPSLKPGRYYGSGMSTPRWFPDDGKDLVEVDWLPGCAMAWRTEVVQKEEFYGGFPGYAQGEDLEFSLRAKRYGRLVICKKARAKHLHDPSGRPDMYKKGYMELWNRYVIHQRAFSEGPKRYQLWFWYAWIIDTLLLTRLLVNQTENTLQRIRGRTKAMIDIWCGRSQ